MRAATIFTIPKSITGFQDLVVLPRREFERLVESKTEENENEEMSETAILQWSREAKMLKKSGKLGTFRDMVKKEYPRLAGKHSIE